MHSHFYGNLLRDVRQSERQTGCHAPCNCPANQCIHLPVGTGGLADVRTHLATYAGPWNQLCTSLGSITSTQCAIVRMCVNASRLVVHEVSMIMRSPATSNVSSPCKAPK